MEEEGGSQSAKSHVIYCDRERSPYDWQRLNAWLISILLLNPPVKNECHFVFNCSFTTAYAMVEHFYDFELMTQLSFDFRLLNGVILWYYII